MHTEEPDEHPGRDADDEIEHGPLPLSLRPPSRHNAAAARWLRQSVTLPRPVVAAGVLALVVLALLVLLPGSGGQLVALVVHPAPTATATPFGGPTSVPVTPTPSPFPTPTPVAPPLGAIPTDCSPSPTGPVVGGFGGTQPIYAVGTGPVWVDGFDRTTAIISITQDQTGPYDEYGWPVFTALAMKAPFEQVVTLQGKDPRTGAPLWFSLGSDSQGGAAPLMTVDPQQGFHSGGGGAIWYNGMMYLPGAGCYTLQASWAGGGWQITFAAGQ